jgi:putative endonuclease
VARHWSETLAKRYLVSRGCRLLAENYTVRGGELDLVVEEGGVIVFVEVRQRRSNRYGSAAESIGSHKIARLRRAALHYLVTRYGRDDLPVRFDAIVIEGDSERHTLHHLKAAF